MLIEDPGLRDRKHVFFDRKAAGRKLAQMLVRYQLEPQGLILAIPAGGVPVGVEIAKELSWPLELLLVKKLPLPWNPEAGFGAMTLEGDLFLNEEAVKYYRLSDEDLKWARQKVLEELRQRNKIWREGRDYPDLSGKTTILVDDGLASGFTMLAGINFVKRKGASKIIVAVPTSPPSSIERLLPLVDELYCPNIRSGTYFAVAEAYQHWHDLDYEEVLEILRAYDLKEKETLVKTSKRP